MDWEYLFFIPPVNLQRIYQVVMQRDAAFSFMYSLMMGEKYNNKLTLERSLGQTETKMDAFFDIVEAFMTSSLASPSTRSWPPLSKSRPLTLQSLSLESTGVSDFDTE